MFEETHLAEFAKTHLADFAERLSLSEELGEAEAGSEILQVEACDQTSFSIQNTWMEFTHKARERERERALER